MAKLTRAQAAASNPQASAWVEANAGTGKTHVLTARVLRLLAGGTDPEKILCLTYTRAAAAEMANRIQDRLGEWVTMADEDLAKALRDLSGAQPDASALIHARTLFARILELPRGLPIQTIHAFCQSLLGRFPVESGLSPSFELLDERNVPQFMTDARDRVLAQARDQRDGRLSGALDLIAGLISEQQFSSLFGTLIAEREKVRKAGQAFGPGLGAALRRAFGLGPDATAESICRAACENEAFNGGVISRIAQAFKQGAKKNQEAAGVMQAWLSKSAEERARAFKDYCGCFLTQKGEPLAKPASKGALDADGGIAPLIAEETERLLKTLRGMALAQMAERTEALLHLGFALIDAFDRLKNDQGLVDYSDLIDRALALLDEADMAGWVLYKLDGGIDHILIDEAQDTNPEQWRIVEKLIGEFFAGESARDRARTVFAVGDSKQSIYGFQGAQPELFGRYRDLYAQLAQQVSHDFREETLDLSFRSTEAVLALVDAVFTGEAAQGLGNLQEQIRHRPSREGEAGLVALWPTVKPEPQAEIEAWSLAEDIEQVQSPEARLANRIADSIAEWLTKAEKLRSRGRPVRPGDIMILVRRRNAFSDLMVRALKLRDIPVAGIDRLNIMAPIAVRDLVALGRFALMPEDDLNLAVLLKSPFIGFGEADLFDLAHGRGKENLWRRLSAMAETEPRFHRARAFLADILAEADYLAPYEFYARLLTEQKGRAKLLARLGTEADDPIDEFLNQALDYEASHAPSLEGFLAWVERTQAELKRDPDQGADEVRVMTVHGAKGLQAPIVFLPDTCTGPNIDTPLLGVAGPQGRELPVWYRNKDDQVGAVGLARAEREAREMAEYRRLLYVALTRAEDRLYIAGWETQRKKDKGCWYDLVAAGMSRLTGQALGDIAEAVIYENPQTAPVKSPPPLTEAHRETPLPAWAENPPPKEPSPPRPLAPSRFDEPVPAPIGPNEALPQAALKRGRLVHKLLEHLPDVAPEKREPAALGFLRQPGHGLSPAEIAEIADDALRLVAEPAVAALFGPGSIAEAPVTALVGDRALTGMIDRLLVSEEKIVIADYKTNRQPPGRPEDIPPGYVRQMAAYRAAMRQIYPGKPIECVLIWTAAAAVMTVPAAMLDEQSVHFAAG